MNSDNIILNGILRCEGNYAPGSVSLYPFATENVSGYIGEFKLKDKSLLTVGSSGDQVINAVLRNCKDITLYDIAQESIYYYYLKCAGLICLTKEEFLEFFRYRVYIKHIYVNQNVFNIESYNKLKSTLRLLDYESYLYFDELFNTFPGITIREELFDYDEDNTELLEKSNLYLKNNILYKEAGNKVKKVKPKFICDDIFNIDDKNKYDNIWLSNIMTWLNEYEDIMKLLDKAYNCLNEDGKLLASYLYRTNSNACFKEGEAPIYNINKMKELLSEYKYYFAEFYGTSRMACPKSWKKDSVLIITKK